MEKMQERLDYFEEYTCVKFRRLHTEEEKNLYDYKIEILWDGITHGASKLGNNVY